MASIKVSCFFRSPRSWLEMHVQQVEIEKPQRLIDMSWLQSHVLQ